MDLFDALVRGDVDGVMSAVLGVDEPHRRELGVELVAHVRRQRDTRWWQHKATALAVAAVGCLPSAAQAGELLGRRSVNLRNASADPVVRVARFRRITWLPDLAYRLAERLRATDPSDGWQFVADLLLAEKAPPPTGDRFVEGWVAATAFPPQRHSPMPLVDRLRADPFLDSLVPRLFEVDGVGIPMGWVDVAGALAQLSREGRLDRGMLLDGCLGRLLRGDRPPALRPFVALCTKLEPTPTEIAHRCGDLLRLLADAPGPVASMAQKLVRGLDTVEFEAVLDTSRSVLSRPEKGLVRTQLGWLDRVGRKRPDRAAEVAAVLAVAVDHPAGDVRDRASALAAKHGQPITAPTVTIGGVDDLPPSPTTAVAPPPIGDADELAEEVAALLNGGMSAPALERVLDAVVRLAGVDRHRLGRALTPVLNRQVTGFGDHDPQRRLNDPCCSWDPCCLHGLLGAVLETTESPIRADAWRGGWAATLAAFDRPQALCPTPDEPWTPPPNRLLRARLAEVGNHVGPVPHPGLLAAPTHANGMVDPTALYERLAALGDRTPWRWDLTQALLRLPAGGDDAVAARAAALGTPAGDRLAGWLRAGGLPHPVYRTVTVRPTGRQERYYWRHNRLPEQRLLVDVDPPDGADDPLGLLSVPAAPIVVSYVPWVLLWPAILPGYRGLAAACALPAVAAAADQDVRGGAAVLPLLAEGSGAGGSALDLALAYGLAARHEVDRVAALDALLMLAAGGALDATGVGSHLGTLTAGGALPLARTIQPLRDAAAAGARRATWRLLAAALPPLLAAPAPPRGTADLLTLAAETAGAADGPVDLPGLAEVAGRGGSNRVVTEARRLAAALRP